MALTFSKSMRSLQTDSARSLLAWLLVAMALLLGWSAWFVLARVGIYEVGQVTGITRDGLVVATFPDGAGDRLQSGQPARLRLDNLPGGPAQPVDATVMEVNQLPGQAGVQAELASEDPAFWLLPDSLAGQVEVEVESLSPATLTMRASQQFLNSAQISPHSPAAIE